MIFQILIFLIVLSLLIFIHEFGHFLAAKKAGIRVEEFGFGYPPRIWGIKIGETIYSLNWIPFGGFVKLLGQELRDRKKLSLKQRKKAFFNKSKKARIAVLLAGVFGNFVLGIVCFTIIYSKLGIPKPLDHVQVVRVLENSPAFKAGMRENDQIIAINDQSITLVTQFMTTVEEKKGEEIVIGTNRGQFSLVPRQDPPEGEGRVGIQITDVKAVFYPWWQMPFVSAWHGIKEALLWSGMVLLAFGVAIQQIIQGVAPQVAGPVGIFQLTSEAAKQGILDLIQFTGVLSINLGVLNLLPIPALDGGHLLFIALERFINEKKREKIEHWATAVGFVFLISLMILVTVNDFKRILKDSSFIIFLKSIF